MNGEVVVPYMVPLEKLFTVALQLSSTVHDDRCFCRHTYNEVVNSASPFEQLTAAVGVMAENLSPPALCILDIWQRRAARKKGKKSFDFSNKKAASLP